MQDTLGGALRDAGNALDNLLEVLGEGFAPAVEGIAGGVEAFAKAIQLVPAPVLATATAAGTAALAVPAFAAGNHTTSDSRFTVHAPLGNTFGIIKVFLSGFS